MVNSREDILVDALIGDVVARHLAEKGLVGVQETPRWEQEALICEGLLEALSAEAGVPEGSPFHVTKRELEDSINQLGLGSGANEYVMLLESVKRRQHKVRAHHNASRPFNCLPTEIGNGIFAMALKQDRPLDTYYPALLRLRLVCTQWYRSIEDDSTFWTLLTTALPRMVWPILLENSRQSPLMIVFRSYDPAESPSRLSRIDFLTTAASQTHRIKSLRFTPGWPARNRDLDLDASLALKSILEADSPLLESLDIDCGPLHPAVEIRCKGATPRLRVVGLGGSAARLLDVATFENLEALYMPSGVPSVSLENLITVIASSPNLVHLTIHGGLPRTPEPVFADKPTAFPRLKTIYFSHISPNIISSVLSSIHAPSCEYTWLIGQKFTMYPPHLYQHIVRHIHSAIQAATLPLQIRCWEETIMLGEKLFYLAGMSQWDDPFILTWTLQVCRPSSVPVHVSVEEKVEKDYIREFLIALDHAFPNITELAVPSKSFLDPELLGKPFEGGPGESPRWLFPNMTKLGLQGPAPETRRLRRVVQIAISRNEEHDVTEYVAPPARLESVHVNPHTPYRTPCYRRILREAQDAVLIKCDALSAKIKAPERRAFYQLAWSHGPLYPPNDGKSWVGPIVIPDMEVVDPQEYEVSTSDEEEPGDVTDSDEDDDDEDD